MATTDNAAPVLLVASGGGHLTQLDELAGRLVPRRPASWVTFDSAQSRELLAGREVDIVPYLAPRAYLGILRMLPRAWRILRARRPELVVSTGAGIALAFLPLARLFRIETHYIESATRAQGPSMTGRVLARVPGIRLHTQHLRRADDRWTFVGSVFEGYEAVRTEPSPLRRAVVALGTMETYGFERLVKQLLTILPPEIDVVWQTGATDVSGLAIDARPSLPASELEAAIAQADVVIAHAGTGTALTCLRLGTRPILVPRRVALGEHVDDHQAQTAEYLSGLGLAAYHEADEIELADLESATGWRIQRHSDPAAIDLSRPTETPDISKAKRIAS